MNGEKQLRGAALNLSISNDGTALHYAGGQVVIDCLAEPSQLFIGIRAMHCTHPRKGGRTRALY